jgi:hypothetical protein
MQTYIALLKWTPQGLQNGGCCVHHHSQVTEAALSYPYAGKR